MFVKLSLSATDVGRLHTMVIFYDSQKIIFTHQKKRFFIGKTTITLTWKHSGYFEAVNILHTTW